MKKCVYMLCLLLISHFAKADQLAALNREQAEKAVTFLKKESVVILWCSCCDNDPMKRVTINEVFVKQTDNGKYYSVVLKGRDEEG